MIRRVMEINSYFFSMDGCFCFLLSFRMEKRIKYVWQFCSLKSLSLFLERVNFNCSVSVGVWLFFSEVPIPD